MQPGAVAILPTAPEVARNSDTDYPYRHDSYFYYLSGFTEPDSVLVLVAAKGEQSAQSILFCRQKNLEREIWEGFRHGPEGARAQFGFDAAFPIEDLDGEMARLLTDAPAAYYALGHSAALDVQMKTWLGNVRRQARTGVTAPTVAHDLLAMLDEMRVFKDPTEQALMLRAATISGQAHARAMRASRPGMYEYEIEAELLHEFRRSGAQYPAYTPIVAAGALASRRVISPSSSSIGKAASTPKALRAPSGPWRKPSQISRSRFFWRQNRIACAACELVAATSTSTLSGSVNPVR